MKDALWNFQHTTIYLESDTDPTETCVGKDILCLIHLVSKKELPMTASIEDSTRYWESLENDCAECPHVDNCILCMVNE